MDFNYGYIYNGIGYCATIIPSSPDMQYDTSFLLQCFTTCSDSTLERHWVVIPSMYVIHYKHNLLISSLVFDNNLGLLIYEFMWDGMYTRAHTKIYGSDE